MPKRGVTSEYYDRCYSRFYSYYTVSYLATLNRIINPELWKVKGLAKSIEHSRTTYLQKPVDIKIRLTKITTLEEVLKCQSQ